MSEFGVLGEETEKFQGPSLEIPWTKKHVRMQCCCYSYSCNTRLQSTTCPVSSSSFLSSDYYINTMTLPWQQSLLPTAWAEMDAIKTPNWQRWLPSWHEMKIHQYFIEQAVESSPAREQPCRRLLQLIQLKILPEQVSRGPDWWTETNYSWTFMFGHLVRGRITIIWLPISQSSDTKNAIFTWAAKKLKHQLLIYSLGFSVCAHVSSCSMACPMNSQNSNPCWQELETDHND